jgi:hypothetical protein
MLQYKWISLEKVANTLSGMRGIETQYKVDGWLGGLVVRLKPDMFLFQ